MHPTWRLFMTETPGSLDHRTSRSYGSKTQQRTLTLGPRPKLQTSCSREDKQETSFVSSTVINADGPVRQSTAVNRERHWTGSAMHAKMPKASQSLSSIHQDWKQSHLSQALIEAVPSFTSFCRPYLHNLSQHLYRILMTSTECVSCDKPVSGHLKIDRAF
jgi:hypothetical protein